MKKDYQKPTVMRIKLVVKEMVLGDCWSSTQQSPNQGTCSTIPENCPYT